MRLKLWITSGLGMEKVRSDDLWEFFSSQRTLFLMMLGVHPETQAPWKQVSPTGHFSPHCVCCGNWYLWTFCEWIILKRHLVFFRESYHEQTKLIKNISPTSFHSMWDIWVHSKLTENSFSPSEFPILWNPPGWGGTEGSIPPGAQGTSITAQLHLCPVETPRPGLNSHLTRSMGWYL